jgi:hypothetical protein
MELYKILVPLIAIIFLVFTVVSHVKGKNTLMELIFWIFFWGFTIFLAFFPDFMTKQLAKFLGIKSNVNAIVFLAIGILFFLHIRLYFILKRQNQIITDLIRKLAIDKKEDNKDN